MLKRFALFGVGLCLMILAWYLGLTWWAYVPGTVIFIIGLLLLGYWDSEADRSGHGARGDESGWGGGL